MFRWQTKRNTW